MKYGIVTFYESYNYGTVLQAYALQRKLKDIGVEADIINAVRNVYGKNKLSEKPRKSTFFKRVLGKLNSRSAAEKEKIKKDRFDKFRKETLSVTDKVYSTDEEYAALNSLYAGFICGSDQIWNPYHKVFSTRYLLDFADENAKKISFSSSFGVSDIKEAEEYGKIKELLCRFDAISVREQSGADIISGMGLKAKVFLDPVFLLDKEEWLKLSDIKKSIKKEKYILVYALTEVSDKMHKRIRDYAKKHKCKIKIIPNSSLNSQNMYDKPFESGPLEFLNLINNAYCVFTNSFHGAAFSILLNKNVYAFIGDSNNAALRASRIYDLFSTFNIQDRVVTADSKFDGDEIDFKKCNEIIENNKAEAVGYLKQQLN